MWPHVGLSLTDLKIKFFSEGSTAVTCHWTLVTEINVQLITTSGTMSEPVWGEKDKIHTASKFQGSPTISGRRDSSFTNNNMQWGKEERRCLTPWSEIQVLGTCSLKWCNIVWTWELVNAGHFPQTTWTRAQGKLPEGPAGEPQCCKSRRWGMKEEEQGRKIAEFNGAGVWTQKYLT